MTLSTNVYCRKIGTEDYELLKHFNKDNLHYNNFFLEKLIDDFLMNACHINLYKLLYSPDNSYSLGFYKIGDQHYEFVIPLEFKIIMILINFANRGKIKEENFHRVMMTDKILLNMKKNKHFEWIDTEKLYGLNLKQLLNKYPHKAFKKWKNNILATTDTSIILYNKNAANYGIMQRYYTNIVLKEFETKLRPYILNKYLHMLEYKKNNR